MKSDMEKKYNYTVMDPTGNITALVESSAEISRRSFIAETIMKKHPEVEQVGFVSYPGISAEPVCLQMAGGEFCGNASMCAAVLFAEHTADDSSLTEPRAELKLIVSGADEPVPVSLEKKRPGGYTAGIKMPNALGIEVIKLEFDNKEEMLPLVRMQGILHLIIAEDSAFACLKDNRKDAEMAVRRWAAELSAEGLGLMFIKEEQDPSEWSLIPLVFIPESKTLFWEHSCASGSSAAGIYLSEQQGRAVDVTFKEPGGDLHVKGSMKDGISLSGSVKIISRDTITVI